MEHGLVGIIGKEDPRFCLAHAEKIGFGIQLDLIRLFEIGPGCVTAALDLAVCICGKVAVFRRAVTVQHDDLRVFVAVFFVPINDGESCRGGYEYGGERTVVIEGVAFRFAARAEGELITFRTAFVRSFTGSDVDRFAGF